MACVITDGSALHDVFWRYDRFNRGGHEAGEDSFDVQTGIPGALPFNPSACTYSSKT